MMYNYLISAKMLPARRESAIKKINSQVVVSKIVKMAVTAKIRNSKANRRVVSLQWSLRIMQSNRCSLDKEEEPKWAI